MNNLKPKDNSSVLSNLSKASKIHQTYLYIIRGQRQLICVIQLVKRNLHQIYQYTIRGQKTNRPCCPSHQSQVTYIKHILIQSEAKRQLVHVAQLVKVRNIHKKYLYTIRGQKTTRRYPSCQSQVTYIKNTNTQSEGRRQLVGVIQLVKLK